jgi:mannose-6-phosphate isomerase-like protein (cupin superfamily)
MKSFTIKDHVRDGEFIVGPTVIGSRTTYLVYNEVAPGQTVPLRAGHGHEEIFLVVAGSGRVRLGGEESLLAAGQGAYLGEGPDGTVTAVGPEPLHYVCAGGHVPGGHHH